ncbi:MAG: hypothetical protein BAJALOKI2v1_260037 [Promethearchaeota archaeon]|nr:MAG: hypothetical protein BAJALOKI2v1_260037 [Candidatus Lokiarchaeota archaeon]
MKNKVQRSTIIILFFVVTLSLTPAVLARSRKGEIIKFITDRKTEVGTGFSNSAAGTNKTSYEATAYALEILDHYKLVNNKVNATKIQNYFTDELDLMLENENLTLYNLYYILKTLDILEYQIDGVLFNETRDYISELNRTGGGFSFLENANFSNVISTYLGLKSMKYLNITIGNQTEHKEWILSCNNTDGGFGATPDLSSRLSTSYYALLALEALNNTDSLPDKNATISFFKSYYSIEGGYLPDLTEDAPLLSSTYYSVYSISLLGGNIEEKSETTDWILEHQNTLDGGFSEGEYKANDPKSSMVNTYFAFQSLKVLNPDLQILNEEIGMAQFNWIILLILLTILGFAVGIGFYIYQERRI